MEPERAGARVSSTGALSRLLIVAWLFTAGVALAGDQMTVITLKHRLADDLVELIEPLLGESGAVSGRGNKLLVRGSVTELEAVQSLVVELDAPALSLLITVVQGGGFDRARLRTDFGFSARVGGVSVAGGALSPRGTEGVTVGGGVGQWSTRQRDTALQRLRATSGYPAWISTGRSVPYRTGDYDQHGHYRDSVVFRDSDTGFSVLPQVMGERVTLQIDASRARMDPAVPGTIDGSGLRTRVTGALGDWLQIGGVSGEVRQQTGAGGSGERSSRVSGGQIWLRVQQIKQ